MSARGMWPLGAALVLAASAGYAATTAAPAAPASTRSGVYTAAQATEGAQIYAERCAMCHGADLAGTWEVPTLKGKFVANWGKARLGALYDYLGHAMPQFAPGSLSGEDDARIVAFLLRENGMPAGARPLPADKAALSAIVFDSPPGKPD